MMEKRDLPIRPCVLHFFLEPGELIRVHVVAVQREKAHVALLEAVIALAAHVEQLIVALIGVVVIAERCIELYPGIQQELVGNFKLLFIIPGAAPAVDVVADHNHKIEGELLARFDHSLGDLVLGPVSRTHVTNHSEPDGVRFQRELELLRAQRQREQAEQGEEE